MSSAHQESLMPSLPKVVLTSEALTSSSLDQERKVKELNLSSLDSAVPNLTVKSQLWTALVLMLSSTPILLFRQMLVLLAKLNQTHLWFVSQNGWWSTPTTIKIKDQRWISNSIHSKKMQYTLNVMVMQHFSESRCNVNLLATRMESTWDYTVTSRSVFMKLIMISWLVLTTTMLTYPTPSLSSVNLVWLTSIILSSVSCLETQSESVLKSGTSKGTSLRSGIGSKLIQCPNGIKTSISNSLLICVHYQNSQRKYLKRWWRRPPAELAPIFGTNFLILE